MSDIERIKIPKVGRPEKINGKILNDLEYAFGIGCNDQEACLFAGIYPSVFYNHLDRHPKFKEKIALLKRNPVLYASQILLSGLKDKPELALKVLEKLTKRYSNNNDINVNVKDFETFLTQIKSTSHTTNDDQEDGGG